MSRVVLDERLWLAGSRWPSMSPDEHRRDRASWKWRRGSFPRACAWRHCRTCGARIH